MRDRERKGEGGEGERGGDDGEKHILSREGQSLYTVWELAVIISFVGSCSTRR